jgi:hypothetical protein
MSRVIAARQHFAACCGVGERLRIVAPTGAAAALLGGSTMHSLLGFQRAKSAVNNDEDDGEQVAQGRARGAVDARHRRRCR